jgi:hypothetical protein
MAVLARRSERVAAFLWMDVAELVPGRAGAPWAPTTAWFFRWREHLVLPRVERALLELTGGSSSSGGGAPAPAIAVAVPPCERAPGARLRAWLYGFFWGTCFVRHQLRHTSATSRACPLWQGTVPRLFGVSAPPPPPPPAPSPAARPDHP